MSTTPCWNIATVVGPMSRVKIAVHSATPHTVPISRAELRTPLLVPMRAGDLDAEPALISDLMVRPTPMPTCT